MSKKPNAAEKEEMNFEASFERLEEILELLNSGNVTLDLSLQLYEEANKLIILCSRKLNEAERKIQVLIKDREGELTVDESNTPIVQDFQQPGDRSRKPTG